MLKNKIFWTFKFSQLVQCFEFIKRNPILPKDKFKNLFERINDGWEALKAEFFRIQLTF